MEFNASTKVVVGCGLLLGAVVSCAGLSHSNISRLIQNEAEVEHSFAAPSKPSVADLSLAEVNWASSGFVAVGQASQTWSSAVVARSGLTLSILSLVYTFLVAYFLHLDLRRRQQLSQSQARLATLVDSSDDAIISETLDGVITSWNKGAERLFGYTAQEVLGNHVSVLVPGDRLNEILSILSQLSKGEQFEHFETVRRTKSGQDVDVSITASPIRDMRGKIIGASAIARDITAQKRAETAVRQSEQQYRLLFDSNPLPMWVFDRSSLKFLAVNAAAIRHYGYSREEFLAMTIRDIRPQEDVPALLTDLARRNTGLPGRKTWRHRKKNGTVVDVEITSHELIFQEKQAQLILALDVTERKRNEERLRQSEEKFSHAFRSSPVAITISTCAEGLYLDVNDAFLKLMEYQREEVIGRTVSDLKIWVIPDDRATMIHQLMKVGSVAAIETRFRTKSGDIKLTQIFADLVVLDGVPCILAITYDISERTQLEEQLRQSQKMEAVGRLAGGVAHDFNNMLGIILGYSELLRERFDPQDPAYKQIELVKKAGERAASLTRQLLAFSRKQVMQPRLLDLNERVSELSKMLRPLLGEDIEVSVVLGPGLGQVVADPGQIDQVIMNLAVNSRDAMPRGGKLVIQTAEAELDETCARKHQPLESGKYAVLAVSDTGYGMDQETISHMFEPFFTTKEAGKGTGLGLSTVYGIVKQSGGHIWVYSEPGHGTTFKIYLPLVNTDLVAPRENMAEAHVSRGSETILVAEDEEAMRELTCHLLERHGYTVLQARSGDTAVELAERHTGPIHLLVTDVVMRGLSGPELAQRLTLSRPELKTVYMSGYTNELIANHAVLEAGITLLEKPFTRESLLNAVRATLQERKPASIRVNARARKHSQSG